MPARLTKLAATFIAISGLIYWLLSWKNRSIVVLPEQTKAIVSHAKKTILCQGFGRESCPSSREAAGKASRQAETSQALFPGPSQDQDQNHTESVQRVKQIIEIADLRSINELKAAFRASQDYPKAIVQAAILESYEALKQDTAFARTKLLWFAKRINGPSLRPMWQDIVQRQTAGGPDYAALQQSHQHLSLSSRAEITEDLIAIEALGQLARSDTASLDSLKKLAAGEAAYARSANILRETALQQIKNCSYTAFIQTKETIRSRTAARSD